jgi:serine/threonine protein kinase
VSVTIGTHLGAYEILSALGAGGMGEVYRARDTRLRRDVALKVLPGSAALEPERRERFEREAQAIAALNHPNIVTIHSIEEIEGESIITMELVEGRSLADLLPKGGLSLDRVLKIAIAVADALVAAHGKGITHRDLKPGNIMLGEGEQEGRVKVLDFGLAKLTDPLPGFADVSRLTTAPITGDGRIVGTVAYMSPEQAEGKATDARSDLFSLGIIVYEMSTGQRPFTGDTSISIISSIVKDTPKSVTELNASLPRELGRIVRRALSKDPERRYQTAKDVRNDLEELKASLDSGELQTQATGHGPTQRRHRARVWQWATAGLAVVSIAAIATLATFNRRHADSTGSQPAPQLQLVRLTNTGNARLPALSPDGKYVAYVQDDAEGQSLWVRQIASNSNVRIVEPVRGTSILGVTVTPDGGFVDFVKRPEGSPPPELWRVPFLGGPPRKIADDVWSASGWSPDGRKMAFLTQDVRATERSVVVAESDGSRPRVVATRKLPLRYLSLSYSLQSSLPPLWLADAQSVAVLGLDGNRNLTLVAVNIATGAETNLAPLQRHGQVLGMGIARARDGSFIFEDAIEAGGPQQLLSVHVPDGQTTTLTNDLNEYAGASVAGDVVVAARQETRASLWLLDQNGDNPRQIGQDVPSAQKSLAWASGSRVIYEAALVGGAGIWSTDVSSGTSQRVSYGFVPSISADGRTLVFVRQGNGQELWRADGDGTHETQIAGAYGNQPSVTPDGSAVFYTSPQSGLQSTWTVDLHGGSPHEFAHVFAGRAEVSPDGRFVMFPSREEKTGAAGTLIMPIAGGEPVRRLTAEMTQASYESIHWTPDGQGLAYIDPKSSSNILVQPLDGGAARQLTHFADDRRIVDFAWSHDGKQLALSRAINISDIVMLKGVR